MSLLNDVLRDLDMRNGGHSDGPPEGVTPALLSDDRRRAPGGAGFGRGQLMRLIVWVLVLLSLVTAAVVGWRTFELGQQALDRIPVDENLTAKPLPASIAAQRQVSADVAVTGPVPSSQYPAPETAALSGPSPGEPESGSEADAGLDSSRFSSSPDAPPTVTEVGETEIIVAMPSTESVAADETAGSEDSEPAAPAQPEPSIPSVSVAQPSPKAKASTPSPPASASTASARTRDSSETTVATLAARRLNEARAFQASGQTQAALDLFDRLEDSLASPRLAPALFSFKAGLLQQEGRYEAAASLYAVLLQMKTADAAMSALESRWWSGLAIAHEQLRQPGRAHAAWLNALSAGQLPATMRSYAAGRIEALGKMGIEPDYQAVFYAPGGGERTASKQDQP